MGAEMREREGSGVRRWDGMGKDGGEGRSADGTGWEGMGERRWSADGTGWEGRGERGGPQMGGDGRGWRRGGGPQMGRDGGERSGLLVGFHLDDVVRGGLALAG